jgi:threonine dehydrogenase-like Zn-dependent dehydrogenase
VWLEPLACVLHALTRVSLAQQPVLIAGAGTFGKLFTQVLTREHQLQVGIVDPNQARLDDALSMGAARGWQVPRQGPTPDLDTQIADWSNGGPALLIDTTGQRESIERLLRWAAPGSTVLLFGVSAPDMQINIAPADLFARGLHLTASAGMTPRAFDAAFQRLGGGKLSLEPLISAHVGLDAVPDLLHKMPPGKVIINPHRSDV